jgi:hypothetical protein
VPQRQQSQTRIDFTAKNLANRPGKNQDRELLLILQVAHLQQPNSWRPPSPRECAQNRAAARCRRRRLLPRAGSLARHMRNSAGRGARRKRARGTRRRAKSGILPRRDLRLSAEDPGDRRRRGAGEEASEGEASAKRLEIWGGGVPARSVL